MILWRKKKKKSETIKHLTRKTQKAVRYNSSNWQSDSGRKHCLKEFLRKMKGGKLKRRRRERSKEETGSWGNIAKEVPW